MHALPGEAHWDFSAMAKLPGGLILNPTESKTFSLRCCLGIGHKILKLLEFPIAGLRNSLMGEQFLHCRHFSSY